MPRRTSLRDRMMDKPATVLAAGKRFFYAQLERPIEDAYREATTEITRNMLADEAQEGVGAFVEKRKPRWRVVALRGAPGERRRPFIATLWRLPHNPRPHLKEEGASRAGGMADDTILETRQLTKEFKGFVAVKDVNLNVARARSTLSSGRTAPARRPASTCSRIS